MASPQSTTASLRYPISEMEAKRYYAGMFSVLVARTSTNPWKPPTGPDEYITSKQFRSVGDHVLAHTWDNNLELAIHSLLESKDVKRTTTNVVRIGYVGEPWAAAPVILSIGVQLGTLSSEGGHVVASECKRLLEANDILDVDVEIWEPFSHSEMEARRYYAGLFSYPILVARTSTAPWEPPTGLEAYTIPKELRPVGDHALKRVWEDNLAFAIHSLLESQGVQWTSTDVVRIGYVEKPAPVILWIGVRPDTLSGEDGRAVASQCKQLLEAHDILDVDVEIRESVVTRSVGPKLPKPAHSRDPNAEVLEPLTPTLGLQICTTATPWTEGTGGFFVNANGDGKLYLVTARHVVFNPSPVDNVTYDRKNTNQPRIDVALFGTAAFDKYVEKIKLAIEGEEIMVEYEERRIQGAKASEYMDVEDAELERSDAEKKLQKVKAAIDPLNTLLANVEKSWSNLTDRVLGSVRLSPPLLHGAGPHRYTQDLALIEIDTAKIDSTNFTGNAVDLGTTISIPELARRMCPKDLRSFKYPTNRLLKVMGTIPEDELRRPKMLDQNDAPCLTVLKRGNASGLTIGRANDVFSYVRNYYDNGDARTSKEWAILGYDQKSRAFSEKGDSGVGVVDGEGRLGGMITGGTGRRITDSDFDITYATPVGFVLDTLKAYGFEATVEATLAA